MSVSAAPASTQQPAVSSPSGDGPNSFASYLKSVDSRQSDQQPDETTPSPKSATGAKDKTGNDPRKSDAGKKKSLLSDSPVPVAVPLVPESKPLTWSLTGNEIKGDGRNPAQPNADGGLLANQQGLDPSALKTGVADASLSAPVAFGVNISNANGAKLDGSKTDAGKTGAATSEEAPPKSASNEAGKNGESARLAETSKHRQGSSDASRDEQPSPSGNAPKAAAGSAHTQTESFAAIHSAAPASATVAAETVHNAYAPAAVGKIAPAAPVATVAQPPQTPALHPQNIDLKIPGANNSEVDVRVSQRAGDVQVTVRTPDGDLAQSLRQHLPELSDRLSQAGAVGEVWQPHAAQASNTAGNNADSRYSDDAQTQQQNQQQHSRGNPNRQQQNETAQQPAWLQELNHAEKETQ